MITRAKRIAFLGFDVGDWLIRIVGIAVREIFEGAVDCVRTQ